MKKARGAFQLLTDVSQAVRNNNVRAPVWLDVVHRFPPETGPYGTAHKPRQIVFEEDALRAKVLKRMPELARATLRINSGAGDRTLYQHPIDRFVEMQLAYMHGERGGGGARLTEDEAFARVKADFAAEKETMRVQAALAKQQAEAMHATPADDVFGWVESVQQEYVDAEAQAMRDEQREKRHRLEDVIELKREENDTSVLTKADLDGMSQAEILQFIREHPDARSYFAPELMLHESREVSRILDALKQRRVRPGRGGGGGARVEVDFANDPSGAAKLVREETVAHLQKLGVIDGEFDTERYEIAMEGAQAAMEAGAAALPRSFTDASLYPDVSALRDVADAEREAGVPEGARVGEADLAARLAAEAAAAGMSEGGANDTMSEADRDMQLAMKLLRTFNLPGALPGVSRPPSSIGDVDARTDNEAKWADIIELIKQERGVETAGDATSTDITDDAKLLGREMLSMHDILKRAGLGELSLLDDEDDVDGGGGSSSDARR